MRKLLFLFIILSGIAACSDTEYYEPIDKSNGVATTIAVVIVIHKDYSDLVRAWDRENPSEKIEPGYQLEGFANFARRTDGTGDCEVHITQPDWVDDDVTLTLGHEMLHCMYGLYHEE